MKRRWRPYEDVVGMCVRLNRPVRSHKARKVYKLRGRLNPICKGFTAFWIDYDIWRIK